MTFQVDTWTHENPHTSSRMLCINLLAKSPEASSATCPGGISIEIDVTDSKTNLPVANSTVELSQTKSSSENEVLQSLTDQQGRLKLDLQKPGSYLVQVLAFYAFYLRNVKDYPSVLG